MAPSISPAPLPVGRVRTGKSATYVTSSHRFLDLDKFEAAGSFALQCINPRPDSERGTGSRYSWAHSAFAYNVVVVMQGGAPPFKFELVSGPTGATCTAESPSWNPNLYLWGRVNWPSPSGTGTFRVRCIDSEGSTKLIEWTCVQNNTKFRFLDASSGSDANNGILVADGGTGPWQTMGAWKGANYADTTYQNLICVYRTGTYTVPAHTGVLLQLGPNKPLAHIRYPGEDPVWSMASARCQTQSGIAGDWYFAIKTTGGPSENNPRLFEFSDTSRRVVFDKPRFESPSAALVADSNYGCIVFMSPSAANPHKYIAVVDPVAYDLQASGGANGMTVFDFYRVNDGAVVGGQGRKCNGSATWWPKGPNTRLDLFGADLWDEVDNTVKRVKFFIGFANDLDATDTTGRLGYSRAYIADDAGNQAAVLCMGSPNHPYGPLYAFRLTLAGAVGFDGTSANAGINGTQSLTDSLIYCDLGTPIESGFSYTDCSVQARSVMATDLTNGSVKNASAFYGVRGADVASA